MKRALFLTVALSAALLATCRGVSASPMTYYAYLDGPSESPPVASPGTGFSSLTIDVSTHVLSIHAGFDGLIAGTTAAHIHGPTADPGVGTAAVMTPVPFFPGFPLGVTSGSYSIILDLTLAASYSPAFITANGGTAAGAEAALNLALAEGKAYLNIHTTVHPAGEIRGFYTLVPEPASIGMLAMGGLALLAVSLRGRRPRHPV